MLTSGMDSPLKCCKFMMIAVVMVTVAVPVHALQQAQTTQAASILDRLNAMMSGGNSAWSDDQLRTMERLRDRAMECDYAYEELSLLTDKFGP